jgi:protein TonB
MKDYFLESTGYRVPQWRISLVFSLIIHLLVMALVIYYPSEKKTTQTPFITQLITPEELSKEYSGDTAGKGSQREVPKPRERTTMQRPLPPQAARPALPERGIPRIPSPGSRSGAPEKDVMPPDSETGGITGSGSSLPGRHDSMTSPKSAGGPPSSPSLREKLFDHEVMEKFAKREETRHDSSITFDTKEIGYENYMMRLKGRIEGIWRYPPDAATRGIYGDLYIRFTIKKNGRLGDLELVRTSGHRNLDEAAMRALKDGEPFWPLPDEWGKDSLTITGHFVYSIYGTYIR